MSSRRLRSALVDQRGIALPLSLIVLTLLTSLTLAFLAMSATEPMIAANLQAGEQALALAEAGIERAIWALNNPTAAAPAQGLINPLPVPAPDPYNGQSVNLGPGSYAVWVSLPAGLPIDAAVGNNRNIIATGAVGSAQRKVQVTITSLGNFAANVPGALTVAGTVQLTGNSTVDGQDSAPGTPNGCAVKAGVTIRDKTTPSGGAPITNSISITGSASAIGSPVTQSLAEAGFGSHLLSPAQLDALKALAQSQGTYIKPTSNLQFNLTVVDGLMFIDTVNGAPLGSPPDASMLASVKITGASNSGWLIVMGGIRIDGNVTYNGLIYALNDISYRGTGTGGIYGAMVSANVVDSVATVVDTDASGNSKIYYDCNKVANGGGTFSPPNGKKGYYIVSGTWKEVSN